MFERGRRGLPAGEVAVDRLLGADRRRLALRLTNLLLCAIEDPRLDVVVPLDVQHGLDQLPGHRGPTGHSTSTR
jgi:hypothetical protein